MKVILFHPLSSFTNIRPLIITSLLGIIHKTRPIFGTQFHPEARGGPLDSSYLFDIYLDSVRQYKANQSIYQPTRDSRPNPMLVDLLSKERVGVVPTVGMMNMMHGGKMIAAKAWYSQAGYLGVCYVMRSDSLAWRDRCTYEILLLCEIKRIYLSTLHWINGISH